MLNRWWLDPNDEDGESNELAYGLTLTGSDWVLNV